MPYNSTITKKKCKEEGCEKYPGMGMSGYCWNHLPEDLKEKIGTKRKLQQRTKNKRLSISREAHKIANEVKWDELREWFLARRKEMIGRCENCNAPTYKNNDERFTWSICHILAKSRFKSVATNEYNWIELCWNCHTQMDNQGTSKWPEMKCWSNIVTKFHLLYPLTLPSEHQYIPQQLLSTLNT